MTDQQKNTVTNGIRAITFVTAVGVLLFDQYTKWLVETNLALGEAVYPIASIDHIFRFVHVYNRGAAFGMLQGGGWLFSLIAIGVSLFITYYVFALKERDILLRLALGLMMGGALGNVLDRIRLGHVTDFIHFNLRPLVADYPLLDFQILNWPVFNVADTAVVTGVVILMVLSFFEQPATEEQEKPLVSQETD
ncbi:MAG: signal peptidase II [Anaerolineales bacterium]|nr:signal peptidase II [Anaerolineales bacterium]